MSEADRLRSIRTFPSLVKYLRDELDWPIETDHFEDLTFDYAPEELIPDAKVAAKLQDIKQLRPLTSNQPWGIFFIKFEPKRLPIVVMRRILRSLVIKKRQSAQKAERPYWQMHDLLFVSSYGEQGDRVISFAHFSDPEGESLLPTLRVLAWDDKDTVLHLDHAHETLKAKLRWPDDEDDVGAWRTSWTSAFTLRPREVIKTSKKLAVCMAEMATRMRNRANTVLEIESENGPLTKLYNAFQVALIHDLTPDDFADMYAQTITYGLFAAAMSRTVPGEGTALVADNLADMVPPTNPFLQDLLGTFLEVGGKRGHIDFDELGVNDVVEFLTSEDTDLEAVKRDFGDLRREEDPVIHFYEDFLIRYDRKKKIQRGVFFTPQPVVSYIVRSVHELLQTEFGLEDGLASTIAWGEMARRNKDLKIPDGVKPDEPFVVILDPAAGTATFLVEVIEVIFTHLKAKWSNLGKTPLEVSKAWNEYVPKSLLPRLYGYELMMAPYTIAHMKLGLKLSEINARLGQPDYQFKFEGRAHIYLTNSLELAGDDKQGMLEGIFPALAHEAAAVNAVKHHKRFTVVLGNPPYSVNSANKNSPMDPHLGLYKEHLDDERNLKPLNDDYVKFFRFAQLIICQAGVGLIGMITNHSYAMARLFRAMRRSLLQGFQQVRFLDLRGDTTRDPSMQEDRNVFDIQQGVGISLYLRRYDTPSAVAEVQRHELTGPREVKYSWLGANTPSSTPWKTVNPRPDLYIFGAVPQELETEYRAFLPVNHLFGTGNVGYQTHRDGFVIDLSQSELIARIEAFRNNRGDEGQLSRKFGVRSNRDWSVVSALRSLRREPDVRKVIQETLYRPFDVRHICYASYLIDYDRRDLMRHMTDDNIGLLVSKVMDEHEFTSAFVTNWIVESKAADRTRGSYLFPLGLLEVSGRLRLGAQKQHEWGSNLRPECVAQMAKRLGVEATVLESGTQRNGLGDLDVFNYVYAVLYSPGYRSRYAEFLKTDFPRLPLTFSLDLFRALAKLGGQLVALHLLESPKLGDHITRLVGTGDFQVEKVSYSDETVWIDRGKTRGFLGVPEEVWNFHIGGYQVCQKWLKDRGPRKGKPGRVLTGEDIAHYQKVVVALSDTIRIMAEIDETIDQHGGWPDAFITEPLDTESKEASAAVSVPRPASKAAKKQNPGKGNFKLRPNTQTVTGRLALSARKEQPKQRSRGKAPSVTDFDRDQLKAALLEVVGTDWIERDAAIRAAAQSLGFKRTGKRIHKAFASAITGLLRQGCLDYDGSMIRRAP